MDELINDLNGSEIIPNEQVQSRLKSIGFSDCSIALQRLKTLSADEKSRDAFFHCLPIVLTVIAAAPDSDRSLLNFERYVQSVEHREILFHELAENPRAIDILIKLFVGSQYLTEILLRTPSLLQQLTNHRRLAEIKSRSQFVDEATAAIPANAPLDEKLNTLRKCQQWELLRIGTCDAFGLFDLKTVTLQLSLLADSIVQLCLQFFTDELKTNELPADEFNADTNSFTILALGKLGGEELNYSSDIDLLFLVDQSAEKFWRLGQQLIQALQAPTAHGFFYRVDLRLRPWGRSGALVNTVDAHINYLQTQGADWEKQALLKARVIAGSRTVGQQFLQRAQPLIFSMSPDTIRRNIRKMKEQIEANLQRTGKQWGEIKAGRGSIRDIEFVTQYLQLKHGGDCKDVCSTNTMSGLVRLADLGFLQADEYQSLTNGYNFLRTVEHALQLMHDQQTHLLPSKKQEFISLAKRLDFPDEDEFLKYYERHSQAIRTIYNRHLNSKERSTKKEQSPKQPSPQQQTSQPGTTEQTELLKRITPKNPLELQATPLASRNEHEQNKWQLTIVGESHLGELSLICGLLVAYGYDIFDGHMLTGDELIAPEKTTLNRPFLISFRIQSAPKITPGNIWKQYKQELIELVQLVRNGQQQAAHGQLAKRVAQTVRARSEERSTLFPVDIEIDNHGSPDSTILQIRSENKTGFLYELTNALAISGIDINRVEIRSVGHRLFDTLFVTDTKFATGTKFTTGTNGEKIRDQQRLHELRAAIVLITHFTHLLPRSPNPETALLQFREFLQNLFQQPNWTQQLSSLERPAVLQRLAKLLGVSTFLWDDFLRCQHENLFPIITDIDGLSHAKSKLLLETELTKELNTVELNTAEDATQQQILNAFKDREMFRIDMRHILGKITELDTFATELSDLADVIVAATFRLCYQWATTRYGTPQPTNKSDSNDTEHSGISVCALGKFGGREMGFASDVELMFLYQHDGETTGPKKISTAQFVLKIVKQFRRMLRTQQAGIFEIDLRLRPYGNAGTLAVSQEAFHNYFAPNGPAWPYERQALVKLRPITGDISFGQQLATQRNQFVYTDKPFDVTAMRALREKQIRQHVQAGTFHAKLSPGGLVDCEYLVQGLQINHGKSHPELRTENTRQAITALHSTGILTDEQHNQLRDAYIFLQRLINALRMVRGNARDLTVPHNKTEEFEFLARRLNDDFDTTQLTNNIKQHRQQLQQLSDLLDQ